jgi:hypothetical protein
MWTIPTLSFTWAPNELRRRCFLRRQDERLQPTFRGLENCLILSLIYPAFGESARQYLCSKEMSPSAQNFSDSSAKPTRGGRCPLALDLPEEMGSCDDPLVPLGHDVIAEAGGVSMRAVVSADHVHGRGVYPGEPSYL